MSETPCLALPLLAAEQAQKHVTHNEALGLLDAIVQLSVKDRDLAGPPGSPADGDRYIVAAGATGAWVGEEGSVAVRQDGAWIFCAPREGWRAYVADEDLLVVFDGADWVDSAALVSDLQNLSLLGIGTTADATNPFSAKLNKALWTAKTAGEGGDGDLRYTMNKETAGDVVSLLLQRGFSGRAEIGLIGDDDLTIKVSPDGAAWTNALVLDRDDGAARFQAGSAGAPSISFQADPLSGFYSLGTNNIGLATTGMLRHAFIAQRFISGYSASIPAVFALEAVWQLHATSGSLSAFAGTNWGNSASGAVLMLCKSRSGTIGTRAIVQSGDTIGSIYFGSDDGVAFLRGAEIRATVDGAPGVNDMPTRLQFFTTADGASDATERLRIDNAGNLQMGGASTVIDSSRHFRLRSYTIATLPAASAAAGQMIYCSDLGGGGGLLVSDGTAWRRKGGGGAAVVATDAAFTLTPLTSAPDIKHTGTLSANRAVTLSTTNAYSGACFHITRTGGGAFTLDVGSGPEVARHQYVGHVQI